MRRCKDDWVNATQILKLCNFPKAKRTKILEKGVQQGQHEKVQGGYGRFQGTWIPLEDARNLAVEYGILAEMVPVLYVDPHDPNLVIPKKARPPSSSSSSANAGNSAANGTPMKRKYHKRAKDIVSPKKSRFDENLPPQAIFTQDYMHLVSRQGSLLGQGSAPSQAMLSTMPPTHMLGTGFAPQQPDYVNNNVSLRSTSGAGYSYGLPQMLNFQMPRGKFGNYGDDLMGGQQNGYHYAKASLSHSTNDTNWSQEDHTRDSDTSTSLGDGKRVKYVDEENSFAGQLLRFFSEDNAPIPYFLYNPPPEFNISEPIDDEGHSPLHWAASIGNINLVHLLLTKGANSLAVSNFGLNPLSKCISFNNCYDLQNFSQMLNILELCLIITDINGRTPLHYLCQFSKSRSKLVALTSYLEQIFAKLGMMATASANSGVDLVKNVVDHQDVNGDTALHLAARAGCSEFVKFLLGHNARDDLVNVNQETAKDIILQLNLVAYNFDLQNISMDQSMQIFNHTNGKESTAMDRRLNGSAIDQAHQYELGTPIQAKVHHTPDTQRTTVQDDDDEELHDRVNKEHLRYLLKEQAGTAEENKENIFADNQLKINEAMSTPKSVSGRNAKTILGALSDKNDTSTTLVLLPGQDYLPLPPRVDDHGNIAGEPNSLTTSKVLKDIPTMAHGMVHLLAETYELELQDLTKELQRIKHELRAKATEDQKNVQRLQAAFESVGGTQLNSMEEVHSHVDQEASIALKDLQFREGQLKCALEKSQAFELANSVHRNESEIGSPIAAGEVDRDKWEISVELSQAQIRRNEMVAKMAHSISSYAINTRMNKYRKLISLSCGLRVEDIDGLIDGIGESLMEGTI